MSRSSFVGRIFLNLTRTLEQNLPGVLRNKSIEPVHQLRVTARRLHNAFWVFEDFLTPQPREALDTEIRRFLKMLGPVRDLDVQIRYFQKRSLREKTPVFETARREYLRHLVSQRWQLQPGVVAAVERLHRKRVLGKLRELCPLTASRGKKNCQPLSGSFIRKKVRKLLRGVLRFERFVRDPQAVDQLHQLRIAAKHLRYTLESCAPFFPGLMEPLVADILRLHDLLGDIHDYHVWSKQVCAFSRRQKESAGFERLTREMDHSYRKAHRDFVRAWDKAVAHKVWKKLDTFSRVERKAG